jgi:hypothetical protein
LNDIQLPLNPRTWTDFSREQNKRRNSCSGEYNIAAVHDNMGALARADNQYFRKNTQEFDQFIESLRIDDQSCALASSADEDTRRRDHVRAFEQS